MPNVSDYIGQSYQRYSTGVRFTVSENAKPPYDPGLVESDQGVVFYLASDGELTDVAGSVQGEGATRGGLTTVRTDANGQATVVFPEPFPKPPASIVTTARNNLIVTGVLELTEQHVTVWVWDFFSNRWWTNSDVDLYWLGIFG